MIARFWLPAYLNKSKWAAERRKMPKTCLFFKLRRAALVKYFEVALNHLLPKLPKL